MAGILDYLPYRLSDEAQKTLGLLGSGASWLNPVQSLPRILMDNREAIGGALGGAIEANPNRPQEIPPGGGGGGWGGATPAPTMPQTAEPMQPVPQFNTQQQAAASFDSPTGSYQFGGQMVPYFGQPQIAQAPQAPQVDEASAQRRGAGGVTGVQINPQGNPVSPAAVAPGATSTGQDKWMEFLDRLSPDYVSRYRQTKQQQQAAQNLAGYFQGRGMNPQQAAQMAAIAATNPKVMEEIFKQPATVEGAIARDMAFGTGGGQGGGVQRALDWKRAVTQTEKEANVQGESRANAQIDLPGAVATAKEQLRLIDELQKHPGRSQIGWHDFAGKAPLIPSTKGYDAANILEQVKSGAFMTAFQTLKGGGQITEKEGQAATAAIARMDRATSKGEFDKALQDYRGILQLGIDRAAQKAGQSAPFGFRGNSDWTTAPNGARIRQVR